MRAGELDSCTPQTPGMHRAAAITAARTGALQPWAGTVVVDPHPLTGAHHHGPVDTVIHVVRGLAGMRWGEHLEYVAEAGPGDVIRVPPYVPHQEIKPGEEPLACVLVRCGAGPGRRQPRRRGRRRLARTGRLDRRPAPLTPLPGAAAAIPGR